MMGNGKTQSALIFPIPNMSKETRLILASIGLYASFLYWGYLQEKITTDDAYSNPIKKSSATWHFPVFMNVMMCTTAMCVASIFVFLTPQKVRPSSVVFFKPAFTASIASPIGFASLQFINYPLLILAKSCKLIPIMLMGILLGGKRYKLKDYVAVAFISVGVALFSMKQSSHQENQENTGETQMDFNTIIGLAFVSVNLLLSGVTSAAQDQINEQFQVTPFYMMKMINFWSTVLMTSYLILSYPVLGSHSELAGALSFCTTYPQVTLDLLRYGLCGGIGQIFVFYIIKEHGTLVNATVTVTRKFFSILISVIIFGHEVHTAQWFGIGFVFSGLSVNILAKYMKKKQVVIQKGPNTEAPYGDPEPWKHA